MKKLIALAGLLIIAVFPAISLDFVTEYVDGILDVKEGGSWYEVFIGDSLPDNAVVRLDEDSYAEFLYGNDTIKLSRAGTYELKKLVGAKNDVANAGMGSLFSGKFKTLLQEDSNKTQTTVGGVRAAEAETVTVDWMSSETAELISDGKSALEEGDLEEAESYFSEAYDYAADLYEESEALYFLGLTAALGGNYADALTNLDMADVEDDSEYYTDFYLLKGQLLVESFAYDEAFSFLEDYDVSAGKNAPQKLQDIYFMIAVAGNNSGNKNAAQTAINKLIALDPGSETAKAAKSYKNNL